MEVAGTVTELAATQTGLPAGIPVIAGCLDAASGALGAGGTRLGQINEQGGQVGGLAISLDHVVVEPQLIFLTMSCPAGCPSGLLHSDARDCAYRWGARNPG